MSIPHLLPLQPVNTLAKCMRNERGWVSSKHLVKRGGICPPTPIFYHEFKNQNTNTALNFSGLRVPANGNDQKDMKTEESAKNHRARLNCHKLAMYNKRSKSSENSLQELEEEL